MLVLLLMNGTEIKWLWKTEVPENTKERKHKDEITNKGIAMINQV